MGQADFVDQEDREGAVNHLQHRREQLQLFIELRADCRWYDQGGVGREDENPPHSERWLGLVRSQMAHERLIKASTQPRRRH